MSEEVCDECFIVGIVKLPEIPLDLHTVLFKIKNNLSLVIPATVDDVFTVCVSNL